MGTHDPRRTIEDLRNHLAVHDRRLAFLFGAGTSIAVNIAPTQGTSQKQRHEPLIPGIEGLTKICEQSINSLGDLQAKAWGILACQCKQAALPANVENMLTKVRMKIDAIGEGENLLGLDHKQLSEIERKICATIAKAACPAEEKIPSQTPHDDFASWAKKVKRTAPLEILTTNYDILFERALETSRIPFYDGFVGTYHPFFYPESIDDDNLLPSVNWIRLWKLHGSINWQFVNGPDGKHIIRTQPGENGEMILPSHRKYDESRKRPYVAYMDRLTRILNTEHGLLITCGYSFGDPHINAIMFEALENKNTANIIALQFQDIRNSEELVQTALQRPNLTVIGPNAGVISSTWGTWQLTQPVDNKTSPFMDSAFDSNALPEDQGSPAATSGDLIGRMRLGDFNWFCRFLKEMGAGIQ